MIESTGSLRVLMTADAVGGVWTYATGLCRALPRVRFVIATMGPEPSTEQRREIDRLPNAELAVSRYRLEWMEDPWADVERAGEWLLACGRTHAPDLVHLNGYVHASLPWNIPRLVAGHSCVLSWWQAVKGEPAPPEWDRYGALVKRGLATADHVVAPSMTMLTSLLTHYGPLPDCSVISNGCAGIDATNAEKRPLIFASGRLWDEGKDMRTLIAAAPELPWPVFVAGAGALDDAAGQVRLLGSLPAGDMHRWFRKAAIYAAPARYEPFGLSVLEAASAGCALVLSDIPTFRELWEGAAVFIPAGDVAAWRHGLSALARDKRRRLLLAEKARQRASRYSTPAMAARYLALYRQLVPSSQALCAS